MFLSSPFTDAFGLDIGDLSLKLVQLSKRYGFRQEPSFVVKEIRSLRLPPGYIVNGELQQPEMVRKKLLQILGREGKLKPIKSPWVVADLPEPKTFLKLITIDMPAEEITEDDVSYHAKKHLLYELGDTYIDWQIIPPASRTPKNQTQILLGAVPKVTSDSYTYLLNSAGLTPLALEIEAISIARAMVTAGKSYVGEARAILDLGATRSSFIVYDNSSIQFSMNLGFSGELITIALMQEFKLDYEQAEALKLKNGLNFDETLPNYLKVVTEVTHQLVAQIKTALSFYKEHFAVTNPITRIVMCGGNANLAKLDNFISRQLKIAAHPGHPWKNLNNRHFSEKDNTDALPMASAIGLGLRAASYEIPAKW